MQILCPAPFPPPNKETTCLNILFKMCRYLQANIVFPLLDDSLVNLILPQSSNQQYKAKGPQRTTNDPPYQPSITPVTCHQAAERGGTMRAHPARQGQTAQAHQAWATEVSPPVKNVESNRRKTEKTNSLFFFRDNFYHSDWCEMVGSVKPSRWCTFPSWKQYHFAKCKPYYSLSLQKKQQGEVQTAAAATTRTGGAPGCSS